MNRMARIVPDPNRTYAGTRTAVQLCGSHPHPLAAPLPLAKKNTAKQQAGQKSKSIMSAFIKK